MKKILILLLFPLLFACSSSDKEPNKKPEPFNPVVGKWQVGDSQESLMEFTTDFWLKYSGASFKYTINKTHIKYIDESYPYRIYDKDKKTYLEFEGYTYIKVQ